MEEPIMLRLTLERMQWQIVQALSAHEIELKPRIERIVKQAVESFDFQAELERQVAQELRAQIQHRVAYAVTAQLERAKRSELASLIDAEVERQLRRRER